MHCSRSARKDGKAEGREEEKTTKQCDQTQRDVWVTGAKYKQREAGERRRTVSGDKRERRARGEREEEGGEGQQKRMFQRVSTLFCLVVVSSFPRRSLALPS